MPSYKYEVIGPDGKPQTGTIDASNLEVATAELKSGGNTIVSLSKANALNKDLDIHIGKAVSVRELSVFCRQFESVLNAGVTVIEALNMLAEQTENKTFKSALEDIRDAVQKGDTLSAAMAEFPKIFPPLMIQMVAAGETTGGIDKAFSRMGGQFEKEAHLKGLIVKSAIYPIILILVIIVVVAIMMIKIVPTFTAQFDEVGGTLPTITRAVMAISDFFVDSWYYMLAIIVGLVIFFKEFKKTENGAIIINGEIENYQEIVEGLAPQVITYGMSDACDFYPADITFNEKACAGFTAMYHGEKVMDVSLNVPGLHNVSNALAAIALALDLKIPKEDILAGLSAFGGADRRFQYKGCVDGVTVIDDYAHHPTEIRATLTAAEKYQIGRASCRERV